MSKRVLVAGTILALLCWGTQAAAQCRKRILLYVDMSGSMGKPPGADSPFRQTVGAVQELLRIPGLIADTDELLLLPFSGTVGSAEPVRGVQLGLEALARIGEPSANDTDLVAVFDDVARRLEQPSGADRELVIVASDFLHSPSPSSRSPNWRQALQTRSAAWTAAAVGFANSGSTRVALALLRAPVRGGAEHAEAFVDGLAALRPKQFRVGVRGQSAAGLAGELSQLFYVPPEVSALLVGPQKFEVTARNAGCMPLTLRDAAVGCEGNTGRDALRAGFPEGGRALEGVSSSGSVRSLTVDAGRLSCPGAYEVNVSTEQGVVGVGKATRESRLEFETLRGILGPQLAHDQLELRVKVWGAVTEPPEFDATLALGAEGRTPLVQGKLSPPRDLGTTPERARIYRIVVRLDQQYREQLQQHGVTLTVTESPSKPQHADVRVDSFTWLSQVLGRPLAGLAGACFLGLAFWRRSRRPAAWLQEVGELAGLITSFGPPAVLLAWGLTSGSIYGWSEWAWLIEWRDALGVVAVGWAALAAVWWALRESAEAGLREELARGSAAARSAATYERRVSFRWPSVLAVVLAVATVAGAIALHAASPRRGDAAVATIPFVVR